MPLASGQRLGSYEIVAPLGAGGMGEVYRARDSKLKREVAIKVLPADVANDRERLARFQREAEVLASLNHPHIAHVYGIEENALVMELVDGDDLSQRISRGPIPIDEALLIAKQIAEALEAAHDAGIVHRDLKPANIKLRDDGTVKVLDFGLAKALAQDLKTAGPQDLVNSPTITSPAMTMRGVILGTAAYMAPEQAKGKVVDKRADIWAFGCVLYEMLTGARAFEGEDATDTIAAVITKEPDWTKLPASTTVGMRRVLQRCLVKDRKHRLRDIGDALHDLMDTTTPIAVANASASRTSRVGYLIAGIAVAAAAALAYPAVLHWRESAPALKPMRLAIEAPPSVLRMLSPAISPDGRSILFGAVAPNGAPELWIRRMDDVAATRIGVTGSSGTPFWSPDGQSAAFPVGRDLVVRDLSSNSSRVIARLDTTLAGVARFMGSWSAEGGIIYGIGNNIYRIVEGQEPTLLTIGGIAKSAENRFPVFLPDGRHFLFLSGETGGASHIYSASIDGGPARQLFPATSQAVYTEPAPGQGHVLFVRNGNLMAQRFSLGSMATEGEPYTVATNVPLYSAELVGMGRAQFDVSRDGILAYVAQPNPVLPTVSWYDRTGKEIGTVGEPALYFGPRMAPDGKRVAVIRLDPQTRLGDVHVIDEHGASQRLTFDPANELQPVWTPDGVFVIYSSHRNGKSQLYRKRSDGSGNEELLYESDYSLAPDDVSADGAFVVFRESHPATSNDLWVLPLDGSGKARPIVKTEADEPRARFSPDGKLVTYMAGGTYAISFPDLTSKWQVSPEGNVPQWRRDGKEIYYQTRQGVVAQPVLNTKPLQLGKPIALFRPVATPRGSFFHASADGQRFLLVTEPPQPDLLRYYVAMAWMKP
jgi:serine/threonine protein kinase/Tol biopolymer transport system component